MKRARVVSAALLVALLAWTVPGCQSGEEERSKPAYRVRMIKYFINDLRGDFRQGVVLRAPQVRGGRDEGREDARMMIIGYMLGKLGPSIPKRVDDASKRDLALAKLAEARKHFAEQLLPEFNKAVGSKKPEDAKALVPLVDKLDEYMDEMLTILE